MGGLGLAPGVNMSDSLAFYEATHGTAPTIAGQDKANPGSVILCGALMLEQMGVPAAAERIRNAMSKAIAGRAVTVDLAAQVEGARVVAARNSARSSAPACRQPRHCTIFVCPGGRAHPCGKGPSSLCFPSRDRGRPTGTTHGLIGKPAPLHSGWRPCWSCCPARILPSSCRTSLTEGRSSGQAAACGVALGIMVHTSAAMLGISAVIAQSVTLFTLLRYAGAAYLFWMGIHALRAGREVTAAVVRHGGQEEEVQPVRGLRRRAFRQGF